MELPNPVDYAVPGFILLVLIEMIVAWVKDRRRYEPKDTLTSLALGTGSSVAGALTAGLLYGLAVWLWQFRLFTISSARRRSKLTSPPVATLGTAPTYFTPPISASAVSSRFRIASAWATRISACAVSRTRRPTGSRSGTPTSVSSSESCWEMAEGL